MEFLLCLLAVLLSLFAAHMGTRTDVSVALTRMLIAVFALLLAMRYWFVLTRWLGERETLPLGVVAVVIFWVCFLVTAIVLAKLGDTYIEVFDSVHESLVARMLGGLFGLVSGVIVASSLMMTVTILAPKIWPAFDPKILPLPVDEAPLATYRLVEKFVARVGENETGHTLLPELRGADAEKPDKFWR